MHSKDGYYASVERQRVGEASVRSRFDEERRAAHQDLEVLESLYTEVGMKAFTAFNNCLEWLSQLGGRSGGAETDRALYNAVHETLIPAVRQLQGDMDEIRDRLGHLEGSIASLEAGMRRIDKFTLEAFRNIKELEERSQLSAHGAGASQPPVHRGRLAKEEAAELALEAARRMQDQGRRLTLAAVAREAGLKYGQIVYAFGNKEGFFEALRRQQEAQGAQAEHEHATA